MNRLYFEWDDNKNKINLEKHKISFEEASTIFWDDDAIVFDDPIHSTEEERFLIVGMSKKANMLTVVHCLRENETVIRIISARKATTEETKSYVKRRHNG